MRDSVDTEADFGTLPPGERCCLSGVSSWLPKHLGLPCSLGDECFVPVLLLRSLIRRKLDTTTSAATGAGIKIYLHVQPGYKAQNDHNHKSQSTVLKYRFNHLLTKLILINTNSSEITSHWSRQNNLISGCCEIPPF